MANLQVTVAGISLDPDVEGANVTAKANSSSARGQGLNLKGSSSVPSANLLHHQHKNGRATVVSSSPRSRSNSSPSSSTKALNGQIEKSPVLTSSSTALAEVQTFIDFACRSYRKTYLLYGIGIGLLISSVFCCCALERSEAPSSSDEAPDQPVRPRSVFRRKLDSTHSMQVLGTLSSKLRPFSGEKHSSRSSGRSYDAETHVTHS